MMELYMEQPENVKKLQSLPYSANMQRCKLFCGVINYLKLDIIDFRK